MGNQPKNLLICDGSGLLHQAFWVSQKNPVLNSQDIDTGTIAVFLTNLKKTLSIYKPDKVIFAWDERTSHEKNFRQTSIINEYKANRNREDYKKIYAFVPILNEFLGAMGITTICPNRMEADDVISWLCSKFKETKKTIVSGDSDLLQLLDENTSWYSPIKKLEITPYNYFEHYEVPINKISLYKAIVGDSGDNIKGLPKIGKVKGTRMVLDWANVVSTLTDEQKNIIRENLKIIDLKVGYSFYPDEVSFYEAQLNKETQFDHEKLAEIAEKYELENLSMVINQYAFLLTEEVEMSSFIENLFE